MGLVSHLYRKLRPSKEEDPDEFTSINDFDKFVAILNYKVSHLQGSLTTIKRNKTVAKWGPFMIYLDREIDLWGKLQWAVRSKRLLLTFGFVYAGFVIALPNWLSSRMVKWRWTRSCPVVVRETKTGDITCRVVFLDPQPKIEHTDYEFTTRPVGEDNGSVASAPAPGPGVSSSGDAEMAGTRPVAEPQATDEQPQHQELQVVDQDHGLSERPARA